MSCRVFRAMTGHLHFVTPQPFGRPSGHVTATVGVSLSLGTLPLSRSRREDSHSEIQSAHSGELTERGPILSSLSSVTIDRLGVRVHHCPCSLSVLVVCVWRACVCEC